MISTPTKLLLATLFSLATLALIVYSGAIEKVGGALSQASFLQLAVAATLFAGMRVAQVASFHLACTATGTPLCWKAAHELTALKGFYNLGISGAGLVAQAAHANATKSLNIAELGWATAVQSVVLISSIGLLLMATTLWTFGIEEGWLLIMASFPAILCPLALLAIIRAKQPLLGIIPKRVGERVSVIVAKADDVRAVGMLALFLVQSALVVLRVSRLVCIALFIDASLDIGSTASITLSADLASVVPLTPGGLGVREFFLGLGARLFGQFEVLLAAAVIDRGITILGNAFHGGWVLARLSRAGNDQLLPPG